MPDIKKKILCGGLLIMGTLASNAIPARQGFREYRQPDGSTLQVELRGDEYAHCYISDDGFPLLSVNGELRYAEVNEKGEVAPSLMAAIATETRPADHVSFLRDVDPQLILEKLSRNGKSFMKKVSRSREDREDEEWRGLFPGTFFPVRGKQKALVILVEYADVKMTLPDAADYFSRMLNEPGFSDYGATGSVADYFRECSSGIFDPEFDLYGPVTLSQNRAYYGGNDFYGRDQRPQEMVIEACRQLEGKVDFSEYDRDGDGVIDNVFIFYAGEGESNGAATETVWPHSFNISSYPGGPYLFNGVVLDRYACSYEWDMDHPDGVGTIIHEFSHVMGLPDLYATTLVNSFTPGPWSVLDYGPYNNKGRTPPLYSVYERNALGWIEPIAIETPVDATLYPISTNQGGIIRTPRKEEYYLIENRQKEGWDEYLPGHGMLIWHIDYDRQAWASNGVNNNYGHQRVDLIEADWEETLATRAGDAFPGTAGITEFTDDTKPSMITWEGERLGIPLTSITEHPDGSVKFKISGGGTTLSAPDSPEGHEADCNSITVNWASSLGFDSNVIRIYNYTDGEDATPFGSCRAIHVGSEGTVVINDLEADTEYLVTIASRQGWEESPESLPSKVRTARLPLTQRAVVALPGSEPDASGFSANWLPLEDAASYLIDIYTKKSEGPYVEICDFSGGTKELPEGWVSGSVSSYANDAYSGIAPPALRLSNDGDYIRTPLYGDEIKSFSFWHRGNSTSEEDRIIVEAIADESYILVADIPVSSDKGGTIFSIDESADSPIPSGAESMQISYLKKGAKGALAIDDIKVSHGDRKSINEEDRIIDYPAGTGESCRVSGLTGDTDYYYIVTAVGFDGERSLPSEEMTVKTLPVSRLSEKNSASKPEVGVTPGEIIITGSDGEIAEIIGIDGVVVKNTKLSGRWLVKVTPGIYIVKIGSSVFRVAAI
ncbi:MAG: M6 family metalloprotease domain-containing protein [Muribaculaceae bacterium]|nr:M6 family metalloprotease domain-containing protein [Muribaculaceae bacterium]